LFKKSIEIHDISEPANRIQ